MHEYNVHRDQVSAHFSGRGGGEVAGHMNRGDGGVAKSNYLIEVAT